MFILHPLTIGGKLSLGGDRQGGLESAASSPAGALFRFFVVWLSGCLVVDSGGFVVSLFRCLVVVWRFRCLVVRLFDSSCLCWFRCFAVSLSGCLVVVWWFRCLVVKLFDSSCLWWFRCSTVSLSGCLVVW